MFWDCEQTKQLWSDLHIWLSGLYGYNITYSRESVLLFIFDENIDSAMYSVLILIYTLTKRTIYTHKDTISINYTHTVNVIKKCEVVERNAAIAKKAIQKHFDKWGKLYLQFRD